MIEIEKCFEFFGLSSFGIEKHFEFLPLFEIKKHFEFFNGPGINQFHFEKKFIP
jgi:hypothetical protein